MPYTVTLRRAARTGLASLPQPDQRRIVQILIGLESEPRPVGTKALVGHPGMLRIRMGNYRIVYEVHEAEVRVLVIRIGHRREVYRGL